MAQFVCEQCRKEFSRRARRPRPGKQWRFCSVRCWYDYNCGERCHFYRGGNGWASSHGYRDTATRDPKHRRHRKCREHTAVVERLIGRNLPRGAEIHHVNEVKTDNRPENLVVCQDRAYHMLLHVRAKRIREFGSPTHKRCSACHSVLDLVNFYKDRSHIVDGKATRCKRCSDKSREARRSKHICQP